MLLLILAILIDMNPYIWLRSVISYRNFDVIGLQLRGFEAINNGNSIQFTIRNLMKDEMILYKRIPLVFNDCLQWVIELKWNPKSHIDTIYYLWIALTLEVWSIHIDDWLHS